MSLTGGHRNDVTQLVPLIDAVRPIRGRVGRPRKRPVHVLGDRAYDHDKYRRLGVSAASHRSSPAFAQQWAVLGLNQ